MHKLLLSIAAITMVSVGAWAAKIQPKFVQGSVSSSSSSAERLDRARISYSAGTPSVATQSGSWISGVADTAVGRVTLTWTAYSSAPVCTCSGEENASSGVACTLSAAPTTTGVEVRLRDLAATLVDANFNIQCIGPR